MSSVQPVPAPVTPIGTDRINATALDGVLHAIAAQINAVIAAMGVLRQGRGRLRDRVVPLRALSLECLQEIREHVRLLVQLRRQYATNYDPAAQVSTDDATRINPPDLVQLYRPASAAPASNFRPVLTIAGDVGAPYKVHMRLRSFARAAEVSFSDGQVWSGPNRLLFTPQPAAPTGSTEIVGVEAPTTSVVINALLLPDPSLATNLFLMRLADEEEQDSLSPLVASPPPVPRFILGYNVVPV